MEQHGHKNKWNRKKKTPRNLDGQDVTFCETIDSFPKQANNNYYIHSNPHARCPRSTTIKSNFKSCIRVNKAGLPRSLSPRPPAVAVAVAATERKPSQTERSPFEGEYSMKTNRQRKEQRQQTPWGGMLS